MSSIVQPVLPPTSDGGGDFRMDSFVQQITEILTTKINTINSRRKVSGVNFVLQITKILTTKINTINARATLESQCVLQITKILTTKINTINDRATLESQCHHAYVVRNELNMHALVSSEYQLLVNLQNYWVRGFPLSK